MKCKIFEYYFFSEDSINAWLKSKPYIVIEKVVQFGRSDNPSLVIFYSDRRNKLNAIDLLSEED